jgi:hypothetical protein
MQKKSVVGLTNHERNELVEVANKLKGISQKVLRMQILECGADGPNQTGARIADPFSRRT